MADPIPLAFSDQGQGTPLVLLHGFPLNKSIWSAQQSALSGQARVVCPDLRGHGDSPAPPGPYDLDLFARDILNLLDVLKIDKAILMGHSMGGYVTLAAWQMAPKRFTALGLICSQAAADTDQQRQGRKQLIEKVGKEGPSAAAEAMLPKLLANPTPVLAERIRSIILQTKGHSIQSSLEALAGRPERTSLLAKIDVPLLIIAGSADQIIPIERAESMAKAAPQGRLVKLSVGHMAMLEDPDGTTKAIQEIFQK